MEQIVAGALGGLGFSIVFGVRKKYMLLIALNAGLSWAVFLLVNAVAGAFAANIASAMFCSSVAAALAGAHGYWLDRGGGAGGGRGAAVGTSKFRWPRAL